MTARHISEWSESDGDVLWWHGGEAPYCGSPLCLGQTVEMRHYVGGHGRVKTTRTSVGGWPGYHRWWTPLPERPEIPKRRRRPTSTTAAHGARA